MIYDRVLNGEVVETRDYEGETPQALPAAKGLGQWFPRVIVGDEPFDPLTHVKEGPVREIGETQVTYTYTVRAKNETEVAALIRFKKDALEREYQRRCYEVPGEIEVDGVVRTWHFDMNGVTKVGHILQLYGFGVVSGLQPWKPYEEAMVPVSQTGFVQIAAAYAMRDVVCFGKLQLLKGQLEALTDPVDIQAFDPLAGWDD